MTQVTQRARHRATGRPSTALDATFASLTASIPTNVGRGAVVAVASSGLVLGGSAVASAAPDTIEAPSIKSTQLTAAEITRAGTQSTVVVDAAADLGFTAATVTAEAPPPPPPPVVRTVTASRTRTADTTQATEAPAQAAAAEAAPVEESYSEPAPAPAIDGSLASAVVNEAFKYVGTPYVSGGASPSGFDCSGFVQYVFAQVGISLPRTSGAQAAAGYQVSYADARAGDLVYTPGHIGIYLGDGQHIAARNPSTPLYASQLFMSNPIFIRVL